MCFRGLETIDTGRSTGTERYTKVFDAVGYIPPFGMMMKNTENYNWF